jgi:hypothetical protein
VLHNPFLRFFFFWLAICFVTPPKLWSTIDLKRPIIKKLTEHLKGKGHKDTLLRRSDPTAFKAQQEEERELEQERRQQKWQGGGGGGGGDDNGEDEGQGWGLDSSRNNLETYLERGRGGGREEDASLAARRKRQRSDGDDVDGSGVTKLPSHGDAAAAAGGKSGGVGQEDASKKGPWGVVVKKKQKSRERTRLRKDLERTHLKGKHEKGGNSRDSTTAVAEKDKKAPVSSTSGKDDDGDDDEAIFRSEDGPFDDNGDIDDIFWGL